MLKLYVSSLLCIRSKHEYMPCLLIGYSLEIVWQIENEYGNIQVNYGQAGKRYMQWAAQMALGLDTGIPWVMCRQTDAPEQIVGDLTTIWDYFLVTY
jgi:hypothetical protein